MKDRASDLTLDLAHLSLQTLGDRPLQREVLTLFADHATGALRLIRMAETRKERRETAHSLVGSARGIGAFEVAARALAVEDGAGDSPAGLAALERAVEAARREIEEYLSER